MMRQDSPGSIDVRTEPGGNTNVTVLPVSQTALVVAAFVLGLLGFVLGGVALLRQPTLVSVASDAQGAAVQAAVANERADKAERSARLSLEYAVMVYPELNRLGFHVLTPGENHETVPPASYRKYESFVSRKDQEQP